MRKKVTLFFLTICFFLVGCTGTNETLSGSENPLLREVAFQEKEHQLIEEEITISAIGDMLIHSPVYEDARNENGYDFIPMLEKVKPYLEQPTITIANQETMIGGDELGLSTYPSFNSPHEVGDALKEVGVNIVTIANNHTLDRGEEAIHSAIEHWEKIDMMYAGSYKNQEDRDQLRVYETEEGISVAILSYTYGTNGIPVPDGKNFLVNLIDRELMAMEMEEAKEAADVVLLSLHFGNEYERFPNDFQKDLVQFAADYGVHAVIGHHPHVLQPVEWVTGEKGNQTLVAYSLGNFLSNQQGLYKRIGGILNFSITKSTKGDEVDINVHSPQFQPTYVTFKPNYSDYEVVPMYQLTNQELSGAAGHYEEIKAHMSQWMPELEFIES